MEPRKHAVTMKTEKAMETLTPLEGGKDTKENINIGSPYYLVLLYIRKSGNIMRVKEY